LTMDMATIIPGTVNQKTEASIFAACFGVKVSPRGLLFKLLLQLLSLARLWLRLLSFCCPGGMRAESSAATRLVMFVSSPMQYLNSLAHTKQSTSTHMVDAAGTAETPRGGEGG
jgi:hypothetical protein